MPASAAAASRRAVSAMVIATALWGGTFVVLRDALPGLTVATLVFARFGVAALIFGAAIVLTRRPLDRLTVVAGLACAPLILACVALQASGLRETSAGSSAFLTSAGTLAAPFFAWAFLRQRSAPAVFLGMALALAGSALLSWRPARGLGAGELLTFLGSVAYALQLVIVSRVSPRVDPVALTGVQSLGVALCMAPFTSVPAALAAFAAPGGGGWRLAYLALAGTVLAPLLQVTAQRTLPTGRVALLFALEPVFALIFAVAFGGERFLARWWAGATLILAAVVIAEWRSAAEP